ncbi:hypothetical protein BLOT_009146 [Blomia tropicalis]|nr:hypothetical protein BLOT_009146 [Blomia tropicalis]
MYSNVFCIFLQLRRQPAGIAFATNFRLVVFGRHHLQMKWSTHQKFDCPSPVDAPHCLIGTEEAIESGSSRYDTFHLMGH